jgi:hypothetical protein
MWLCDFVSVDGELDGMAMVRTYMPNAALLWESNAANPVCAIR